MAARHKGEIQVKSRGICVILNGLVLNRSDSLSKRLLASQAG